MQGDEIELLLRAHTGENPDVEQAAALVFGERFERLELLAVDGKGSAGLIRPSRSPPRRI